MNRPPSRSLAILAFASLMAAASPLMAAPSDTPDSTPFIRGIRLEGTNVVVTVYSPDVLRRITLECRPRLGTGNWLAREVAWPDGRAGEFTFTLPMSRELEMMRVKGEDTGALPLPASFYQGRSAFGALRVADSNAIRGGVGGIEDAVMSPGGLVLNNGPTIPIDTASAGNTAPARPVVESDIWQLDGTTLYFFNQNRGLQVIDVSNPDSPVLRGQLPMASVGEQMYLLPGAAGETVRHVALLVREGCDWNRGAVVIARVENGSVQTVTRLPLAAQAKESRLVGDALYVATQGWKSRTTPGGVDPKGNIFPDQVYWENVTTVEAFDLSSPTQPVAKPVVELAANPNAISATDRFLFIAVSGSQQPQAGQAIPPWAVAGAQSVIVFDISDPHGQVVQLSHLSTAGQVADKFKLNLQDSILSVVSQTQGQWDYTWIRDAGGNPTQVDWTRSAWRPPVAQLETFSLAQPANPVKLGHLSIVTNENVFATRFDGNRAYVVTFRQTDPLWIVDLSDPAHPAIRGELQVPGWSTYIQPMGDRLLAMGQENWSQPSVSLYDVADVTKPKLIQRIFLGQWAWSEASYDEKAFKVFPEAGMVLLPWSGQREKDPATGSTGNYFQGMQLLDFSRDSLVKRGVIEHTFQARRATLLDNRILSLSGTELISADATDRDHPQVRSTLELAPVTDRVFTRGDRLVEVALGDTTRPPRVRIAAKSAPDALISTLSLTNLPIVGLELKDKRLFVLQKEYDTYRQEELLQTNEVVTSVPQRPLITFATNVVITLVPQPPKLVGSNLVEQVIPLPPLPGDPTQRYQTNWVWRALYENQPPLSETNYNVTTIQTPQPPLLVTNQIIYTNHVSVRVPGAGSLSVVDVDAAPQPAVLGQTRFEFGANYYGSWLEALWPQANALVWAPPGQSGNYYMPWVVDYFPAGPIRGDVGLVELSPTPAICLGCGWFPWWGSQATPELLAFDTTIDTAPRLASRVQPPAPEQNWSGTSPMYAAGGKIYFSHTLSRYIPPATPYQTVTNLDGTTWQQWMPGEYEVSHYLDVVDYADPAAPVLAAPISFPGSLEGLSHGAALLYAKTTGTNGTAIAALAFDGLQASLVDSLPLPPLWPQPSLVRLDGRLIIGRASSTNTEPSTVETWALAVDGKFTRLGSLPVGASIQAFHSFGNLLTATTSGNELQLLDATDPQALKPLTTQPLDCSYWFNLDTAVGSLTDGLWLPRNLQGIWHIPTTTAP